MLMKNAKAVARMFVLTLLVVMIGGHLALAQSRLTIGSSPPGGVWYPLAAGLAEVWNNNVDDLSVTVEGTGGSLVNPRWLADEQVELALNSLDMFYAARDGTAPYEDDPQDLSDLRAFMLQHSSPHFVVTQASSDIQEFRDLEGKRVAIGDRGAAANQRALWMFEAHGMDPSDVNLEYIGDDQAAGALGDGRIDAWIEFIGVPAAPVMNLAETRDIRFVPLSDDGVENLLEEHPFFVPTEIPAGTYTGQEEGYVGYGVTGALMINESVDADLVYEMCMAVEENRDQLLQIHQAFEQWTYEPNIETITGQPLHSGVERCYEELGVM